MMPNMSLKWPQMGSQNGTKTVQNEVLEAYSFKAASQVASSPPKEVSFGEVLEPFWDHVLHCSNACLVVSACACQQQVERDMFKLRR